MKRIVAAMLVLALGAVFLGGCAYASPAGSGGEPKPAGPIELPPKSAGEATATPSSSDGGVMTAGGETIPGTALPGGPVSLPGGPGNAVQPGGAQPPLVPPSGKQNTMNWLTYRDDTYKFEIRYPPNWIIQKPTAKQDPQPVRRIDFMDKDLAKSETAALQPPLFTIEVYDNSAKVPLDKWLRDRKLSDARSETAAYSVGGLTGVRVSSMLLLAPNEFYYLAQGTVILRLIPMGAYSNEVLASLKAVK